MVVAIPPGWLVLSMATETNRFIRWNFLPQASMPPVVSVLSLLLQAHPHLRASEYKSVYDVINGQVAVQPPSEPAAVVDIDIENS